MMTLAVVMIEQIQIVAWIPNYDLKIEISDPSLWIEASPSLWIEVTVQLMMDITCQDNTTITGNKMIIMVLEDITITIIMHHRIISIIVEGEGIKTLTMIIGEMTSNNNEEDNIRMVMMMSKKISEINEGDGIRVMIMTDEDKDVMILMMTYQEKTIEVKGEEEQ